MKNYLLTALAIAACPVYATNNKAVDPTDPAQLARVVAKLPKKHIRHDPQLARQIKSNPYPWLKVKKDK